VRRLAELLELAATPGAGDRELALVRAMAFVRFQQPLPPVPARKGPGGGSVPSSASFYGDYDTLADLASRALQLPLPQPYVRLAPVRTRPPGRPRGRRRHRSPPTGAT
jgi:hypothetical protein